MVKEVWSLGAPVTVQVSVVCTTSVVTGSWWIEHVRVAVAEVPLGDGVVVRVVPVAVGDEVTLPVAASVVDAVRAGAARRDDR